MPGTTMDYTQQKPRKKGFFSSIGLFFKWFGKNRRIQVIFFILVLSAPVFLIIYGIVLPVKNYTPSPTSGSLSSDTTSYGSVSLNSDQVEQVSQIIRKENEKAFEQARLSLAEKDSVYVILDVPNKAILLEIKGVTVKKTEIINLEISNRFSLISHENLLPWLSQPFSLERDLSTIPKDPIVVKQAPKDTIEAAKMSNKPAPPDSTNVFFTLYFDRNLVVEVEQAEPLEKGATEKVETYQKIKRKESTRSVLELLRNPQQKDQPMLVKLVISDAEARAVYRAVPIKSKLILKL
jgi:hypothetical protein